MFSTKHRFNVVLALVLAAAAAPTALAQADERRGAVAIRNLSNVAISIQMRLGTEGAWTDYSVPPATYLSIHFALDQFGQARPPYIRFENSQGCVKEYRLEFYAVEQANLNRTDGVYPVNAAGDSGRGKPYKFEYKADTGWDLFTAD